MKLAKQVLYVRKSFRSHRLYYLVLASFNIKFQKLRIRTDDTININRIYRYSFSTSRRSGAL